MLPINEEEAVDEKQTSGFDIIRAYTLSRQFHTTKYIAIYTHRYVYARTLENKQLALIWSDLNVFICFNAKDKPAKLEV